MPSALNRRLLFPALAICAVAVAILSIYLYRTSAQPDEPNIVQLPQLEPPDLNPESARYSRCDRDGDCLDGRACFAGACRREPASAKPYGPCEFNRACPLGYACREFSCKPLRRTRTAPDYVADDATWPQFFGPNRDGHSSSTGLLRAWPRGGPPVLWMTRALGRGFGHPAVTKDRLYVTGLIGAEGRLTALDLDGRTQWQQVYGPEWRLGGPAGARQTPTVTDRHVLVTSGFGVLYALDRTTGAPKWTRQLFAEGSSTAPFNGYADAPLVHDGKVFVLVGSEETMAAAFDEETGQELWRSPSTVDRNAYGSLVYVDAQFPLLVGMVLRGLVAIDPRDGRRLWLDPVPELPVTEIASEHGRTYASLPIYRDGRVMRTLHDYEWGLTLGARQLVLNGALEPSLAWVQPDFGIHYGGAVLLGDTVYGVRSNARQLDPGEADVQFETEFLAIDWNTGRVETRLDFQTIGQAGLLAADELIFGRSEFGVIFLIETRGERPTVISRFQLPELANAIVTYPALADGVLYIRNQDVLWAYDVTEPDRRAR